MKILFLALIVVVVTVSGARADVITFFDFNDSDLNSDRGRASVITTTFTTTTATNNVQFSTPGSTVNADPGDGTAADPGNSLALRAGAGLQNNGNFIQFSVNTTNFEGIVLDYATQRSDDGFNSDQFQYSTNGTTFIDFDTPYNPSNSFALQIFDLSGISELNNNPNAAFRIIFNGATAAAGNNRIDNLAVTAQAVPEPTTTAMILLGLAGGGVAGWKRRRKSRIKPPC